MLIQAITIFPEMFDSITEYGVTGRAKKDKTFGNSKPSIPANSPTTNSVILTTAPLAEVPE